MFCCHNIVFTSFLTFIVLVRDLTKIWKIYIEIKSPLKEMEQNVSESLKKMEQVRFDFT